MTQEAESVAAHASEGSPSRIATLRMLILVSWLSAGGLAVVSAAYALARAGTPHAGTVYWFGMALLGLPMVLAAASRSFSAQDRLGLMLLFTALTYGVKVFYHPLGFAFPDELQHLRTALDIRATGGLFTTNHLLPVSPYYPGLELVTNALTSVTGVSTVAAGFVVAGLAKLTLVGALFWLYDRVTLSSRTAMIATLVFAANPHFLFFGSIYAYQTLAIPFAVLALLAVHRWVTGPSGPWMPLLTVGTLAATTVTHHLTSYALVAVLGLWWAVARARRQRSRPQLASLGILLLAIAGWQVAAEPPTVSYLLRPFLAAFEELRHAMHGMSAPPITKPSWEMLPSLGAIALVALLVPLGALRMWFHFRRDSLAVTLAILAFGFFASLGARFLPDGAELAGRLWDFAYVAIAPVVAVALVPAFGRRIRWRDALVVPVLAVLLLGSITLGYPPETGRLPGPYLASAFERSVEPLGIAAARWQADELTPGTRVAADYTNAILSGSYGDQDPVFTVWPVYLAPTVGPAMWALLEHEEVRYIVVDRRLCQYLPENGYYFLPDEAGAYRYTEPLDCSLLTKFDRDPRFERSFDDGPIAIYRLSLDASGSAP